MQQDYWKIQTTKLFKNKSTALNHLNCLVVLQAKIFSLVEFSFVFI
jgi:hypothetical protein